MELWSFAYIPGLKATTHIMAENPPGDEVLLQENAPVVEFAIAPYVYVRKDDIFSEPALSACRNLYYIFLAAEYFVMFSCLPGEVVRNRPGISILSSVYTTFSVCTALMFVPYNAPIVLPTRVSYRSHFIPTCLHFVALILNVWSLIALYHVKEPLLLVFSVGTNEETKREEDVTRYFHNVSFLMVALISMVFSLSLACTIIHGMGLYRIANHVGRKTKDVKDAIVLEGGLPGAKFVSGDVLNKENYLTKSEIHKEISTLVNNAFF